MNLILGADAKTVWIEGCHYLKSQRKTDTNVILQIQNPCALDDLDDWIQTCDPAKIYTGSDNLIDVVNTIFPYKLYAKCQSRFELYERYKTLYERGRKIRNQSWGTYFQRLISFDKHFQHNTINQLENAIVSLNSGRIQHSSIVFHLSGAHIEKNTRPRGGTCWHFGELLCDKDKIHLLAVYRNHDYFNKLLGNIIGLGKLLQFICNETNMSPGLLTIHSANAFYPCPSGIIDRLA